MGLGALTGVAQSVGSHSTKQKVTGSTPSQGKCLGCGFSRAKGNRLMFLSLSFSLFSLPSKNKHIKYFFNGLGGSGKPRIWTHCWKTESREDHIDPAVQREPQTRICAEAEEKLEPLSPKSPRAPPRSGKGVSKARVGLTEGLPMGQLHPPFPYA